MTLVTVYVLLLWTCNAAYEIIYAINCGGSSDIPFEGGTYMSDRYYQGDSRTVQKTLMPKSIQDKSERLLIKNERTAMSAFSYHLPMKEEGHFGILLKFYEFEIIEARDRVFDIKLGDQVIWKVDIAQEVGIKKPLVKLMELEVNNGVVYRGGIPILNGFNFVERILHLKFEKVKGNPKVEAIIVVKGELSHFRKDFVDIQNKTDSVNPDYLCERLHDAQHVPGFSQNVSVSEASSFYYLQKVFSLRGLLSLGVFLGIRFKDWVIREIELRATQLQRRYKKVDIKVKTK